MAKVYPVVSNGNKEWKEVEILKIWDVGNRILILTETETLRGNYKEVFFDEDVRR